MKFLTIPVVAVAAVLSAAVALLFLPAAHPRASDFFLSVRMASSAPGHVQVYFDQGRGLSEENSAALPLAKSDDLLPYRLPLPSGTFQAFRFDPIDRDGTVVIEGARIVDSRGRTVRDLAPAAFRPLNQIDSLREVAGRLVVVVTPGGGDPQLLLPFAPPLALEVRWGDAARAWLEPAGCVFAAVLALCALAAAIRPRVRLTPIRDWFGRRPGRSIAIIAAIAVVASAYPVVFLGRSHVSPNLDANLLYDAFPTLPGYRDSGTVDVKGSDIGAALWQFVPESMVQRRALVRDHEFPLWNRDNSCGLPLLGQGQSMFGDPCHLIVLIGNGSAWSWDLKYLVAKWLFALGLGLIVLALTRHLPASLIVAFAAPFIGFFIYRINHGAFFSLCYAPWPLYFWLRIAQSPSWRSTAGYSLGWVAANASLLASGTVKEAWVLMLTMNFSGLCLLLAARIPWKSRLGRLAWLAWLGCLLAMLTAPLWYTFLETLAVSVTNSGSASAYQIQPALMLGAFDEAFYRPLVEGELVFNPSVNFLILGGLLYFAATLRVQFSNRFAMALAGTMLVSLGVVFGVVPPAWIVRIPFIAQVSHVDDSFSEALIVLWSALAGIGFATAAGRLGTAEGRDDLTIAGLLLLTLVFEYLGFGHAVHRPAFLHERYSLPHPGESLPTSAFVWWYLATLLAALGALGLTARRALRHGSVSPAQILSIVLCAGILLWRHGQQAGAVGFDDYAVHPTGRVDFHAPSEAIGFVQRGQRSEPGRGIGLQSNFCPGWTDVYGLEGISGPDALKSPAYIELTGLSPLQHMTEWWLYLRPEVLAASRPFLDFLNVRYYFATRDDPGPLGTGLTLERHADLDVYESPTAWPRAFFVDRISAYREPADLMRHILSDRSGTPFAAVEDSEAAAVPSLGRLVSGSGSPGSTPAYGYALTENGTSFTVRASGPGIAVLTESYWAGYPHAEVDGRKEPVIRVNHAFEGVLIDSAGVHRITIAYRPRRFSLLLGFSAAGGLLLLGSCWRVIRGQASYVDAGQPGINIRGLTPLRSTSRIS